MKTQLGWSARDAILDARADLDALLGASATRALQEQLREATSAREIAARSLVGLGIKEAARDWQRSMASLGSVVEAYSREMIDVGAYTHLARQSQVAVSGTARSFDAMAEIREQAQRILHQAPEFTADAFIARAIADQYDIGRSAQRFFADTAAQTRWIEDLQPYVADLGGIVQSLKSSTAAFDIHALDFAAGLVGPFDESTLAQLARARTRKARLDTYRAIDADPRLTRVPRPVYLRQVRTLARVPATLRRRGKPTSAVARALHRYELGDDLFGVARLGRAALHRVRDELACGLRNRGGDTWLEMIPSELRVTWRGRLRGSGQDVRDWLDVAESAELVDLVTLFWDAQFEHRITDRFPFEIALRTVVALDGDIAQLRRELTRFDVWRLGIAAAYVLKALDSKAVS